MNNTLRSSGRRVRPIVFDPLELAHYFEYSSVKEIIATYELHEAIKDANQDANNWIDQRFERVVFDVDENGKGLIVLMKYNKPKAINGDLDDR